MAVGISIPILIFISYEFIIHEQEQQAYGAGDYCSDDYCIIDGELFSCAEDMSKCDTARGWLNLTSSEHKFPTEVKNVEYCTSQDYAICKIDGYLVECEDHVDMCITAKNILDNTTNNTSHYYDRMMDRFREMVRDELFDANMIIPFAYGQDVDPKVYCLINEYPYIQY